MSYPNIIKELQEFQANLINLIYPIGSIYMSVNNVSPQVFLGGSWEQIQDTFLLSAGSKHSAGSTGGEETHTLSVAETPAHTHTRGTMNITGSLSIDPTNNNAGMDATGTGSGAITSTSKQGLGSNSDADGWNVWGGFTFDASKSWTGATSSVGGNTAHNNMPPYLTVYMWKRIA